MDNSIYLLFRAIPFKTAPLQLDTTSPVIAPLLEAFPNVLYSEVHNRSQRPLLNRGDVKKFPSLRCQLRLQPKRSHSVLGMGEFGAGGTRDGPLLAQELLHKAECVAGRSWSRNRLYHCASLLPYSLRRCRPCAHASTDGT